MKTLLASKQGQICLSRTQAMNILSVFIIHEQNNRLLNFQTLSSYSYAINF